MHYWRTLQRADGGKAMTKHQGRHFLQIPGPSPVPDRVLRAMDMPVIDHRSAEFAELGKLVPRAASVLQGGNGSLKGAVTETNFGLQLWKLCIILALIFLGAEIAVIRYFKTDRQQVSQPV